MGEKSEIMVWGKKKQKKSPEVPKPRETVTLSEDRIDQFRETFAAFDEDGDGFLNLEQVYQAIHSLGKVWPMKDIREALPKDCKEVDFPDFLAVMAQDLASDFNSEKDIRFEEFLIFMMHSIAATSHINN